jgi:hypothetical protein
MEAVPHIPLGNMLSLSTRLKDPLKSQIRSLYARAGPPEMSKRFSDSYMQRHDAENVIGSETHRGQK